MNPYLSDKDQILKNMEELMEKAREENERRVKELIARADLTATQQALQSMYPPPSLGNSTASGYPVGPMYLSGITAASVSVEDNRSIKKATLEWSIEEIKSFLKEFLPKSNVVPFLWGPPGIGKSASVTQVAKELGWEIIDLRLSQLNPVDLRGLPIVDRKKNLARWLPPEFLPNGNKKGILFLDEMNNAPLSVQAAAFELILDKRLGNYRFPDRWRMVAAGNREGESITVYRLPAPLANRFIHIDVGVDFAVWKKWAEENKIDQRIIEFLEARPRFLFRQPTGNQKTFPSPRSWAFSSELIEGKKDKAEVERLLSSAIGPSVAHEFAVVTFEEDTISVRALMRDIEAGKSFNLPKDASVRAAIIDWALQTKLPMISVKRLSEQMSEEEKMAAFANKQLGDK